MYSTKEGKGLKNYRLFISHAWTYNTSYYRLIEMLNDASRFRWSNYSVPEHDPLATSTNAELRAALRNQISPTHIVIILAGMYVNHRDWIQKEMEIAAEMGKPMIGIKPWGQQRTPLAVQDAVVEMVGWNTSSIVSAIRKYAL